MVVVFLVLLMVVTPLCSSVVLKMYHETFSQLKMRLDLLYQTPLVSIARSAGAGNERRAMHGLDVASHVWIFDYSLSVFAENETTD